MGKIKIQRLIEYKSHMKGIEIEIDGRSAGRVKNGNSLELELNPGLYSLKANLGNGFCCSNSIEVNLWENDFVDIELYHKSGIGLINFAFYNKSFLVLENTRM